MSYNPSVPLSTQSPGLFPAQGQANFGRLKTIISGDHVFNDSVAADDGVHNQCTFTATTDDPVSVPAGTISRLYSKVYNGNGELFLFNGATATQLTPYSDLLPIRNYGSQSVANGASFTIPNLTYDFSGSGTVFINSGGTIYLKYYSITRVGTTSSRIEIVTSGSGGSVSRPSLSFTAGGVLQVVNNDSATRTLQWSLVINRII